jgi:hexosaminidase
MNAKSASALVLLILGLAAACAGPRPVKVPAQGSEIFIVPKPVSVVRQPGSFRITSASRIAVPAGDFPAESVGRYLAERLRSAFGLDLPVSAGPPVGAQGLIMIRRGGREGLGAEGYELSVTPAAVSIAAPEKAGLFYGVQTLLQLLPPAAYGSAGTAGGAAVLPCVKIEDMPRLPWRGMLLDVSRHFFPKEFIKRYLDYLALHKMNTFHWHLTDDQGWRLEIKKYPRLTEVGAWRVDREDKHWNSRPPQGPGDKATLGGFYTQNDVREILAYAESRHITVVPEIEMPGHCLSALAAYPQLSCSGGPFTVPPGGVWPIKDVYCAGNDETFAFLEDVLGEVVELFPGKIIHIGGDEVDKSTWKVCPKCQARIKAAGLKTAEELQSWFIRRIETFLNARGRTLMGWDEILEGGLAPNAAVMSWRGVEGGIAAAKAGHPVVMTPTSNCYFDYYQGDPALEPPGIGGFLPLSKVYAFEPVPAVLTPEESRFIVGAQGNLWTEYIATPSHAEYMTFPRIAAMAEAGWTSAAGRDWDDFLRRLTVQLRRYDRLGVNYARSVFAVKLQPASAAAGGLALAMSSEAFRPDIRYTLDGTDPKADSAAYRSPLTIKASAVIRAAVFENGALRGSVSETRFRSHLALGRGPSLRAAFKPRYTGGGPLGLVDGLLGSRSHTDGRWQGFEGDDLDAVIDLGEARKITAVTIGFLRNTSSWIFLPRSAEAAVSLDGTAYKPLVAPAAFDPGDGDGEPLRRDIRIEAAGARARYIRVTAKSIGLCPPGHSGAGGKAWLMADEIIVE